MQRERKYIMDELKYLKAVIKNNIFDENGSLKYNYKFSTYSSLYASTTEIIKGYLDKIELEGLSILAPAASGDHALECLSRKAKLVETFDINSYAFHMQNLKFAAVKNLSRNEFICFFYKYDEKLHESHERFSIKIYKRIRHDLPNESKLFWDKVYLYIKDSRFITKSNLILGAEFSLDTMKNALSYISEENYYILQEKLKKFDINSIVKYNCDLLKIDQVLKRKYDVIILSNICDYIQKDGESNVDAAKRFRKYVKEVLSLFLNDEGIIISEYKYYFDFLTDGCSDNDFNIWKIKRENNFKNTGHAVYVFNKQF